MKVLWVCLAVSCLTIYLCLGAAIEDTNLTLTTLATNEDDDSQILTSCPLEEGVEGIYQITVPGLDPFSVLCSSQEGGGWTVVASRIGADLSFYRNWEDYKKGFGDLSSDFFIGLEKLHYITKSQTHELNIEMEDYARHTRFARYDEFYIENENESYKISKLGSFSGEANDSLSLNMDFSFSTYDRNASSINYAIQRLGGWWHNQYNTSNLFGVFYYGIMDESWGNTGMSWERFGGSHFSYKRMKMMVRPKCPCS